MEIILASIIHFSAIALTVIMTVCSVGIGISQSGRGACHAIQVQPGASNSIRTVSIIGMGLIEATAIISALAVGFMLVNNAHIIGLPSALAELGIVIAIGVTGIALGVTSAIPVQEACIAIARQPFLDQKIIRFLVLSLSFAQTPLVFGFILALINYQFAAQITNIEESARFIAAGIAIGFGCIGPLIGLTKLIRASCRAMSINKQIYPSIFSFSLISQVFVETPIILSALIAMIILFISQPTSPLAGLVLILASICISMSTIGAGISSGNIAATACHQMSIKPSQYSPLSKIALLSQGLTESSVIFAMIISLALIFIPFH